MTPVIGVDGCPAGWIAVIWGSTVEHRLCPHFSDVLALEGAIIAIDMPIGLPDMSGRPGDRDVRARLGGRRSSVFPVPSRAAVMCDAFSDACRENLTRSDPPKKVSKQCYNLFPKMREIDQLITPKLQDRVFESHPELAFWAMNDETALPLPKKVKSQCHEPGLQLRRSLLQKAGFPLSALPVSTYRRSDVGADDVIDACACAWVARRIVEGRAIRIPAEPTRDGRGLRMEINA